MTLLIGSLTIGLILSILAFGVFISFRVFNMADITVEGSFTLGAALAATLIIAGINPILATLAAMMGGFIAGAVTGILNTRFKVNPFLAGILVMISLYSVNLRVMGKSNLPLLDKTTLLSYLESLSNQVWEGKGSVLLLGWKVAAADITVLLASILMILIIGVLLYYFFRTHIGTAMRAAGNNPQMIRALGENTDLLLVVGIALANALVALAGAILAQYQGFADVQMGIGMMVWGIASLIIGEVLIGIRTPGASIIGAVIGAILFRLLVSLALKWGMNPNDLKIITAVFVLIALVLPGISSKFKGKEEKAHARG
ncbi:MAG: ABC transporter permease [Syntrophomonas sp.]